MKTLIVAVLLSSLSAPVLAMDTAMPLPMIGISSEVLFPGMDEFGRRSGLCPKRGAKVVAREGSTCGGV
jgi:hypothetical protein